MNEINIGEEYKTEAELLKTLGHPIRLKIIEVLVSNKSCVKNIWESLGISQATVSQHLISLKNKGIVSCKRDGVFKSVNHILFFKAEKIHGHLACNKPYACFLA